MGRDCWRRRGKQGGGVVGGEGQLEGRGSQGGGEIRGEG